MQHNLQPSPIEPHQTRKPRLSKSRSAGHDRYDNSVEVGSLQSYILHESPSRSKAQNAKSPPPFYFETSNGKNLVHLFDTFVPLTITY